MTTPIQRSRAKGAAQKALFHEVTGAGKSNVKRQFFGLSDADEQWLEQELDQCIDLNIRKDG